MTARSNRGMTLFEDDAERQLFIEITWTTVRDLDWRCLTYCLMPNHFHLLVQTPQPNLSQGMQRITTAYARRYNDRRERYGHVFQGRFASKLILSEQHLFETIRYIALNPVRADVCAHPSEYLWSGHRAILGLEPPRLVAATATRVLFGDSSDAGVRAYREFVGDIEAAGIYARRLGREERGSLDSDSPAELSDLAKALDRDSLILKGVERGYSFAAIGRELGCNRSTVARRYALLQGSDCNAR